MSVSDLFAHDRSRVKQLVSDLAAELPARGLVQRPADRPADMTTVCRSCGTTARLGSPDVCCWWPFGCRTRVGEPDPRLCWGLLR